VNATLAAGQELLYVSTHADGIDALLPAGRILCALKDRPPAPAFERHGPACMHSGQCHRLSRPLVDALRDERLVPCHALRARLLFLDACHMVPITAPAGGIDARYSLFAALLENERLGSLLLGLDQREGSFGDASGILAALQAGEPVGQAVGRFLASPYALTRDIGIALFGDPAQRIGHPAFAAQAPAALQHDASATERVAPCESNLRHLLTHLAGTTAARASAGEVPSDDPLAEADLALVEGACSPQGAHLSTSEPGPACERLLDRMLASGQGCVPLAEAWATGLSGADAGTAPCFDCGRDARVRILSVAGVRGGRHRMLRCWHCAATAHQPEGDHVTLHWPAGGVSVEVRGAVGVRAARWHLSGKGLPGRHASLACPLPEPGGPAPALEVRALGELIGPISLSWVYLRGDDWGVATVRRHFGAGRQRC
jgi:hypothetical protein